MKKNTTQLNHKDANKPKNQMIANIQKIRAKLDPSLIKFPRNHPRTGGGGSPFPGVTVKLDTVSLNSIEFITPQVTH